MLGRPEWLGIVATGILSATVSLGIFTWMLRNEDLAAARNLAFTTVVFGELFRAFAARSARRVFWEVGVFSNLGLLGVVVGSATLQIALHHVPLFQMLFGLEPISLSEGLLSIGLGLIPATALELVKVVRRALGQAAAR
jgi:Ca2+-transporting ATPase